MPAYVVVNVDVLDEEAALAYAPLAQASIVAHGGRYLVAGPTPEPVEGSWDAGRFLIIEFPDMDRVRQWYVSPQYRRARAIRADKVSVGMLFVEGTTPPEAPL